MTKPNTSERRKLKKEWFIKGTLGALFLGAGLCGLIESGFLKHQGVIWYQWFLAGTIALCVTVAGIVLLIRAGILDHEIRKHH